MQAHLPKGQLFLWECVSDYDKQAGLSSKLHIGITLAHHSKSKTAESIGTVKFRIATQGKLFWIMLPLSNQHD